MSKEVYRGSQQDKSTLKEYGGKALKWGGVIGGIIGLIRLNLSSVVLGSGVAIYGKHVETKNKQ